MKFATFDSLPVMVQVAEIVSSRYDQGCHLLKPEDWDERCLGQDVIRDTEDRLIRLKSSGGQSSPRSGWRLVLRSGEAESGYEWTLYGFDAGCKIEKRER